MANLGAPVVIVNSDEIGGGISTGPVAPATATATETILIGAQYNAADLVMTEGQQAALRMDLSGALKTSTVGKYVSGGDIPALTSGQTFPFRISTVGALLTEGQPTTSGNPFRMSGIVRIANSYITSGNTNSIPATTAGALVFRPHSLPEECWSYAAASSGIVSSTADVAVKAAGAAGVRNYINSMTVAHDTLSAVSELVIKDGSTVLFRTKLQTTANEGQTFKFDPPLRGTAATAVNVAMISSVTGGVYVNLVGYQAQ